MRPTCARRRLPALPKWSCRSGSNFLPGSTSWRAGTRNCFSGCSTVAGRICDPSHARFRVPMRSFARKAPEARSRFGKARTGACRAMRATMKTGSTRPLGRSRAFRLLRGVAAMRARLDVARATARVMRSSGSSPPARTNCDELGKRLSAARALLLRAEVIRMTQRRETVLRVAERSRPAFEGQVVAKARTLSAHPPNFSTA